MFDKLFPSPEDYPLPPPPGWISNALLVVCLLSFLLPAGIIRVSSGAIILGMFFYTLCWTESQTIGGYTLGAGCAGTVCRWLDLVAIHQPELDFWRVEDGEKIEGTEPKGPWENFKWFFSLWMTQRGIGWNIQGKNLPPSVPDGFPRKEFIKNTLWRSLAVYIGHDLTSTILLWTRAEDPFFSRPLQMQVFLAWAKAFRAYYSFELSYSLVAAITVSLNLYKPQDWPPLTGSFRTDAWSVRNMWGKCWHQVARRSCSEAGRIVKEFCGFKKGTFLSKYSQIWVAFAVSALLHHAGAVVGCFEDRGFWQMIYFLVQPLGIMLEDLVIYGGKSIGIKESVWVRRLGFLWVTLWFSVTLRAMVAYQPNSWANAYQLPSIIGYVFKSIGF